MSGLLQSGSFNEEIGGQILDDHDCTEMTKIEVDFSESCRECGHSYYEHSLIGCEVEGCDCERYVSEEDREDEYPR